jgi:hypothetical protein
MDDEVKLWYDFISRSKEETIQLRRYLITLILPCAGAIIVIASTGKWNPIDYVATFEIAILMGLILVLELANINASREKKAFTEIQYGILSGQLADREHIQNVYDLRIGKIAAPTVQKGYNEVVSSLEPKP